MKKNRVRTVPTNDKIVQIQELKKKERLSSLLYNEKSLTYIRVFMEREKNNGQVESEFGLKPMV